MADISQIQTPDGTSYDIKDTTSRSGLADKMDKTNPTGTGSFSLNRKADTTIGTNSFAEGVNTTASGNSSHAEGYNTTASGVSSHAEGYNTTASSDYSHAEGAGTSASGSYSHAEGRSTIASGSYSHTEGNYTVANHAAQHVIGEFNIPDNSTMTTNARGNYVEIVGNGTANNSRSNARTLDWQGNEVLAGTIEATGLGATLKQAVIDAIYPVGSIYMSVSSTNPGTTFGVGTWEAWGSGRVPVGVDSNDTSFDTVEETGGKKSNSYTPAGTNSGCAVAKHTYTPAGTNSGGAVAAHTYTPAGTVNGHTLTAAESGMPRHRHSGTSLTVSTTDIHGSLTLHGGSTSLGGLIGQRVGVLNPTDSKYRAPANHYKTQFDLTDHTSSGVKSYNGFELSASHSHTISGDTGYAGGTSGQAASNSHTHTFTGTQKSLTHTVTNPTFTGTQATLSHTVTNPTFTGTAANISTVQPYITCYMWKRTA